MSTCCTTLQQILTNGPHGYMLPKLSYQELTKSPSIFGESRKNCRMDSPSFNRVGDGAKVGVAMPVRVKAVYVRAETPSLTVDWISGESTSSMLTRLVPRSRAAC